MASRGIYVKVFPAKTTYEEMESWNPDGYFISNGPGDPAAMDYAVQTVKNIKIINKTGASNGYSPFAYDIDGATQNKVIYPSLDPMIFELKFPNEDIKARVVNL